MGERVDEAIGRATAGLVERDVAICDGVVEDDQKVNDLQREARDLTFTSILTQAPVARDLREILGFLHMASELERMGDHCVNIARIAKVLADIPAGTVVAIPEMAALCAEQVRDMLGALVARDIDQARTIAGRDDRVDRVYHQILDDLIEEMREDSSTVYRATNLILVAHNLERIADRVTNLAEDLVFLETGTIEELG